MRRAAFALVYSTFRRRLPSASPNCAPRAMCASVSGATDARALRVQYSASSVDDGLLGSDPITVFASWFDEAVSSAASAPPDARWEANAMCLSTVGEGGRPSSRMVLLKSFDERGFVWYTNYESRKGGELSANELAALVFWWPPLERSVRVEGVARRVASDESDAYFASRPPASRIAAAASEQSRPVTSAAEVRKRYDALCNQHLDGDGALKLAIDRPAHWGGYRLVPDRIEFWKGREARMHDRIVYTRKLGDDWGMVRLQP